MVDKVKISVLEKNGEEYDFPTEIDSSSDHIMIKGIAFEGAENALIYTDSEKLRMKDADFIVKSFYDLLMVKHQTIEDFTIPETYKLLLHGNYKMQHNIKVQGDIIVS